MKEKGPKERTGPQNNYIIVVNPEVRASSSAITNVNENY